MSSHLGLGVWAVTSARREDFSLSGSSRKTWRHTKPVDTTPWTGWNRIYLSLRGKSRVPRLEIKSSGHVYLLGLTRLRRKYKYRITILFTNSFNVSSKVDSDFSFFFFLPRRGSVLRLFINEKKERKNRSISSCISREHHRWFLLAEEERRESSSRCDGTRVPHAWIRSSN